MRIYQRIGDSGRQGSRALTKNLKKGRRGGRNPKTSAISQHRVVVFEPSAVLNQRINGHGVGDSEWQDPAEPFIGSGSRDPQQH